MGQPHHRGHEHVELGLLLRQVVVEEPSPEPEPGVVHQQPHGFAAVGQPGLDLRQLRAVDEVGRQHLDGDAVRRPQLVGGLRQPVLVAGHEHQVVAARGERAGERTSRCRTSGR